VVMIRQIDADCNWLRQPSYYGVWHLPAKSYFREDDIKNDGYNDVVYNRWRCWQLIMDLWVLS